MSIGVFMPNITVNSEVRVVLPHGDLQTDRMDLLFDPSDWASPVTKRIIVEAGVEVGTSGRNYVLATTETVVGQAGSFNGRLILENNGIISGRGGAANGGVGGDVINANFPGRNGQKLEIINRGTLRAGGGGGGRGGNGGTGGGGVVTSTVREPTIGDKFNSTTDGWQYIYSQNKTVLRWDGIIVYDRSGTSLTQITVGNSIYHLGTLRQSVPPGPNPDVRIYGIFRQTTVTTDTNGGAGGAGGNGGRGQGFGQARTNGSGGYSGAAGGSNAGRGGTGGTGGLGGDWGAAGATGNTGASGANGNRTNGSAGAAGEAGGLAGFYVDGDANVDWLVTGSRQGRLE